jgi:hypothetical protein
MSEREVREVLRVNMEWRCLDGDLKVEGLYNDGKLFRTFRIPSGENQDFKYSVGSRSLALPLYGLEFRIACGELGSKAIDSRGS